jgi:hypothetical protein
MMDLYDVIECPKCGGEGTPYSTDEIEFDVGYKGRYITDCRCKYCEEQFRLYIDFNYSITRAVTSTGCGMNKNYTTVYEEEKK